MICHNGLRVCVVLIGTTAAVWLTVPPVQPLAVCASTQPSASQPVGPTDEDFEKRAASFRRILGENFTVLIEKPFVVAGDGKPDDVRKTTEQTVRWAVKMLKQDFFAHDPEEILMIFLFKDSESYAANNKALFGSDPPTPYGYFSATHKALVMNIGTGGGTLVHEIVHPFIHANFPNCPAWFNEGLGSLYEQCQEKDGRISGMINWRLTGLRRAIHADSVPTFKNLTAMSPAEFYGDSRGLHYATARYLCYYLQERGLLVKYYHAFAAAHQDDPTGYETLMKVLDEKDMAAFEKRWRKWVLSLRIP